ncbi:MAG: DUF3703 domain-containing protein [Burkholderiales bacterium]
MAANAYAQYRIELEAAANAEASGDLDAAIGHLERAHIVGQRYLAAHLTTHWRMLRIARAQNDGPEIRGQVIRLIAAVPGYVFGWVPVGNTGGTNVSALQPMPVPPDLAPYFQGYSVWAGVAWRAGLAISSLFIWYNWG